eukprot:Rmarinus@m.19900
MKMSVAIGAGEGCLAEVVVVVVGVEVVGLVLVLVLVLLVRAHRTGGRKPVLTAQLRVIMILRPSVHGRHTRGTQQVILANQKGNHQLTPPLCGPTVTTQGTGFQRRVVRLMRATLTPGVTLVAALRVGVLPSGPKKSTVVVTQTSTCRLLRRR